MKEIPLTQGKVALVDDEDYARVSALKWCATCNGHRIWYATRLGPRPRRLAILMHRYILGCQSDQQVDHINHDGLDNRRCNLRICTSTQNHANSRKRKNTSSRFKGVYWHGGRRRWDARITCQGQMFWLGYFDSEENAAQAYNEKARELFGEFAHTQATGPLYRGRRRKARDERERQGDGRG